MEHKDSFWKWYLRLIKDLLSFGWVKSGYAEYALGTAVMVLGSVAVHIYLSNFWMLATILGGITLGTHGLWRVKRMDC